MDPNQGLALVYILIAIIVAILGGMFLYAMIATYVIQLVLGVQVGMLVSIGTAVAGTIVGVGLYGGTQKWWPQSVRLAAAFGAPPLMAAVIVGLGGLL